MKKISRWIIGVLGAIVFFLFGFFIRQPQINKLKEQVKILQKDMSRLYNLCEKQHTEYRDLLVQHKALKALQFKKKSSLKEQLAENLVMQYAIWDYVALLIKSVKSGQKMSKEEASFFWAFEKLINGEKVTPSDMAKISNYTKPRHESEIKDFRECDYGSLFMELQQTAVPV